MRKPLCCCCFQRDLSGGISMSTSAENEIVQEPSMARNSSPSRAPKTALKSSQLGGARKVAKKGRKTLRDRHNPAESFPSRWKLEGPLTLAMNRIRGTFHETPTTTCTTGTSFTLSEHGNCGTFSSVTTRHQSLNSNWRVINTKNSTCGISSVFSTVRTVGTDHCGTTGRSNTLSMN